MKILFLVGKTADTYKYKVTSKYAPEWFKKGSRNFKQFINFDNTVPSDVAMAIYMSYHHPKTIVECQDGSEIYNKAQLDPYDCVYVIFDAIEVFHCGGKEKTCPGTKEMFEKALKNTSAFVYPYPNFHKYIINKPRYYADLKRAGIPVAPFFQVNPKKVDIKELKEKVGKKGWKGVIVKPSYAGYSMGIKVYKNFQSTNAKTLKKNFDKLVKHGFPNATVQEFIPSFGDNFEIRTYWINGRYAYSVGTLTEAVGTGDGLPITDITTFKSEGGNLPNNIKTKLIELGKEVQKSIRQYPYNHPLIRIDFGCCLSTKNCGGTYFVNEIETMAANMLATDTNYPVVEKVARALYKFSKEVKGKKEPKFRKSRHRLPKSKSRCIIPPK